MNIVHNPYHIVEESITSVVFKRFSLWLGLLVIVMTVIGYNQIAAHVRQRVALYTEQYTFQRAQHEEARLAAALSQLTWLQQTLQHFPKTTIAPISATSANCQTLTQVWPVAPELSQQLCVALQTLVLPNETRLNTDLYLWHPSSQHALHWSAQQQQWHNTLLPDNWQTLSKQVPALYWHWQTTPAKAWVWLPLDEEMNSPFRLASSIDLSTIFSELKTEMLPQSENFLFDAQQQLIASSTQLNDVGALLPLKSHWRADGQAYRAVAHLNTPDWYWVVRVPQTVLATMAWESAQWILIVGGLLMLCVLVLLYFSMASLVLKPLHRILSATQKLGAKNFSTRVKMKRLDEFGVLARAFDKMARQLGEHEQQIRTYAQNLEQHTRDLIAAKEQAEAASIAKNRFIANISHELRTPLNAIIGYSEMLQEETIDLGIDEFEEDLDKIHRSGKHLLGLINQVLDLSKIEAGKMTLHYHLCLLKPLLTDVLSMVQPQMQTNNNQLILELPDSIREIECDEGKLIQVLLNLLGNAAKFTKNGQISLIVRDFTDPETSLNWIQFLVIDTGIGIASQDQSKIFDSFTQADDSTTREYGGTGLGLNISKRFIELLGGRIALNSEVGKGTCFEIYLPKRRQISDISGKTEVVPQKNAPSHNPLKYTPLLA